MTRKATIPAIPPVPVDIPRNLRPVLDAMRQALQVYGDAGRGDPLDAAVTFRDLVGTDAFSFSAGSGLSVGSGEASSENLDPLDPNAYVLPSAPAGVEVRGTFANAIITWADPVYTGHDYSKIYVQQVASEEDAPEFSEDLLAGTTAASIYAHNVPNSTGLRIWVTHVNINGDESAVHTSLGSYVEIMQSPADQINDIISGIEQKEAERAKAEWLSSLSAEAQNIIDKYDLTSLGRDFDQSLIDQATEIARVESEISTSAASAVSQAAVYTDTETAAALATARSELAAGDAQTLTDAKAYTDGENGQFASRLDAVETANTNVEQRMTAAESGLDEQRAEYEVKATVGELTAAIGIVNDGNSSTAYINADEFYVRKPGFADKKVFYVAGGQLYVNFAVIERAYIDFIVAQEVTADLINTLSLNAVNITGGNISIGGNFTVDSAGNLTALSGNFEGTIRANKIQGDVYSSVAVPLGDTAITGPDEGGTSLVGSMGRFEINVAENFRRWCQIPRLFYGAERVGGTPASGDSVDCRLTVRLDGDIGNSSHIEDFQIGISGEDSAGSDSRHIYGITIPIPPNFIGEVQINFLLEGRRGGSLNNTLLTANDRAWCQPLENYYRDTQTTWLWADPYFTVNIYKESEDIVGIDPATYRTT